MNETQAPNSQQVLPTEPTLTEEVKPSAMDIILEKQRQKALDFEAENRYLFLRNILNGVFILLAILAMLGIAFFKSNSLGSTISYSIGIVAVLVKFAEVILRMPMFKDGSFLKMMRKPSQHK